ncbi:MAG TPA: hypothetical protein VFS10_19860 [Pyrinomonadaceae bacterium]|nr:hypothetical protein [Pyrinomonadaceae bacterium]
MGNYSKNPQTAFQEATQKGYSRVRFQQGKPILDRELNLAADLVAPNRFLRHYVGSGVPEGSNGFLLENPDPLAHDFTIRAGRCIVNGLEVVLNSDSSYKSQPHKGNVGPFPAGGFFVCLRAFTVEVNEAQDPDLKNAGDIGFETALRERVDWEVLVNPNLEANPDLFILAVLVFNPGDTIPLPESEVEASIMKSLADRPIEQALAERAFAESATKKAAGETVEKQTTEKAVTEKETVDQEKTLVATDIAPVPEEPSAFLYDIRLREVTLSKVRGDLDMILDPSHSRLADQTVRLRNFSARILQEVSLSVSPTQSSTVLLAKASDLSTNPWLIISVSSTGSFTWMEKTNNGDRQLVVTNMANFGPATTVHIKAMLIDP